VANDYSVAHSYQFYEMVTSAPQVIDSGQATRPLSNWAVVEDVNPKVARRVSASKLTMAAVTTAM
jgi:hypothetical protein